MQNEHQSREELGTAARPRLEARLKRLRKYALFRFTLFAVLFAAIAVAARLFVYPLLPDPSIVFYLELAEVGIFGFLAIRITTELVMALLNGRHHHPDSQARSARSIVRIGGLLIILAIIVIMLARDPYVTLAVTTVTGIALAVSVQSIIGNAIAGMVLAIVRPFKIGDIVTVFGITGSVRDIGLLYVRLSTIPESKVVLVPNGTMIGTAIVKEKVL